MYKISIDTGGTFTDCICEDYLGNIKRLKILSKSVIRGKIVEQISPVALKIVENWHFQTDFFENFFFSILDGNHQIFKIEKFDIINKIIFLKEPILLNNTQPEHSFEIFTDEEVPVFASRLLTQTPLNQAFPKIELKLGSTKGTNALLENKGAKVLFIVTKGFKNLIEIGNQARSDIFAIDIKKPKPLHANVYEVDEQINAKGEILKTINLSEISEQISRIGTFDSIAICFKNAYKNDIHEITLLNELSKKYNFISISTKLSKQIKFLNRSETAVVNAYLSPIIDQYISRISSQLLCDFKVMSSAGNLLNSKNFHPKDSLLSGPAGGIVGAASIAQKAGYNQIISFDMGGTSTDVARFDGQFDYKSEITIGNGTIFSPALAIETVAAGGGSICKFDGHKLAVGPESAGSEPGPACYGAGGPLTITDVNLLLGRLDTSQFSIPIQILHAKKRLEELVAEMEMASNGNVSNEAVLESLLQIANENIANAAKKISVAKGFNPEDYALVAFGGAGGMHACALANILNIKNIILPNDAGLLSAYGISISKLEKILEFPVLMPFIKQNEALFVNLIADFGAKCLLQTEAEFGKNQNFYIKKRILNLRLQGQDSTIEVEIDEKFDFELVIEKFKEKYFGIYAFWNENRPIEWASIVIISAEEHFKSVDNQEDIYIEPEVYFPKNDFTRRCFYNGNWAEIPVYDRGKLSPGAKILGFALVLDPYSTTVIESGWEFSLDKNYTAIVAKISEMTISNSVGQQAELELFTNRFMAVAEQMGVMLQRTALSVNVKERLDFSCALLNKDGFLIANAPHIPVHLGSLGVCLRSVLEVITLAKDDVVITNHPKYGGSHLPDITIISSVYTPENQLVGYVMNRCHHSEIGGITPASMPPNASNLEQEGVIISPMYLVKNGVYQLESIEAVLKNAKYPTRAINENLADISAAIAANNSGKLALLHLVEQFGYQKIQNQMELLLHYSAALLQTKLLALNSKKIEAKEKLDDGTLLKVEITISESGNCVFDFEGSSGVHLGNLNANQAIVSSVIIYVLRLLLQKPLPLNEGLLQNVKILLPENSILNPNFDENPAKAPAVVGGNVETSQRLTDTILKAFGIAACSQGTMNSTLFGNETFGYYETICGGSGASFNREGASAVHTHMTNTRITDPEIFELRYPVHLKRFEIRQNSGGEGLHKGGDGIIREIEFLAPVKLSVLSQHRIVAPYGLAGGKNGKQGKQKIIRKSGEEIELRGIDGADLELGDRFIIETPGGGGFGLL